ncbi:MAG: hypothetical protein WC809_11515 [Sinimarinibacterium sp.]|jgi:hypothetical protein
MNILHNTLLATVIGIAASSVALAQPCGGQGMQQRDQTCMHMVNDDDGTGTRVYGYQLMTPDEIAAHRARMQAATPQERARIRAEHHKLMVVRARERGVTLPDEPPMGGGGMGPGPHHGAGKNRPKQGN